MKLKLLAAVGMLSTIAHCITLPTIAETPITRIPLQDKVPDSLPAATTIQEWLAQETPTPSVVQVTGVQLNPTTNGLQIVLQTAGQLGQPIVTNEGNIWIATIPAAELAIPQKPEFQAVNPIAGVAQIMVLQVGSGVQIRITGSDKLPKVSLSPNQVGLLVSVTP